MKDPKLNNEETTRLKTHYVDKLIFSGYIKETQRGKFMKYSLDTVIAWYNRCVKVAYTDYLDYWAG